MAQIQFAHGFSWENLPGARVKRVTALDVIVERLAVIRSEWQEAADSEGKSLAELQASVGLLLSDVCDLLELLPTERARVFGLELAGVVS